MNGGRISEEQAQQIWRRAAELQAAAAERAELRRRAVTAGTVLALDGLSMTDVREAAIQAGIGDEFVQAAIAELENEQELRPRPGSLLARTADRLLDDPPHVLTIAKEIAARPDRVLESMQRVFPNSPFDLLLRDTRGAEMFVDGVLVFDTAGPGQMNSFRRKLASGAISRLFVTLRAVRDHPDRCEVTVRAPVGRLGLNVFGAGGSTIFGGGTGAVAGAAAGPSLAAVIGAGGLLYTSIIGAAAVISGVAFGGLALGGYRVYLEHGIRRATDGLDSLVQALAVDVRTQGAFTPGRRHGSAAPDRTDS